MARTQAAPRADEGGMNEPRLNEHRLTKVLGGWRLYCPLKNYSRRVPAPKSGKPFECWGCGATGRVEILKCK